jgi:hypothetical protein
MKKEAMASVSTTVIWESDTNDIAERLVASAGSCDRRNAVRRFRRDISSQCHSLLCGRGGGGGASEEDVTILGFIRLSPDDSF